MTQEQRACANDEALSLVALIESLSPASQASVLAEIERLTEEQRAEEAGKGGAQ